MYSIDLSEVDFAIGKGEIEFGPIKYYRVGSKLNNRVCAAYIIYNEQNDEIHFSTHRLPDYSTLQNLLQLNKRLIA